MVYIIKSGSNKIVIRRDSVCNWDFRTDGDLIVNYEKGDYTCAVCDLDLNPRYALIIRELKEAGLLAKDFVNLCCSCFFIGRYRSSRYCDMCGTLMNADLRDRGIRIFCTMCDLKTEEYYIPIKDDADYLNKYIKGDMDEINDQIAEVGRHLSESDKAYLTWLLLV